MTKILVGLDTNDAARGESADAGRSPVVRLLQGLRFPLASFDVVHVAPSYAPENMGMEVLLVPEEEFARAYVEEHAYAERITESALRALRGDAVDIHTSILRGGAASRLMERADDTAADLIAVNASRPAAPLATLLTGSVARALVVGAHQSVLMARGTAGQNENEKDIPVRAVLATDHSPYSLRAIELLARLAPQGIASLTVMAAYPKRQLHTLGALTNTALDPARAFREALCARNETVIDVLSHHLAPGTTFSSEVLALPVHEAIAHTMRETEANLLILGAQGHGFVERTLLGSVSFHQAIVNAPYSLLVLRP